MVSGPGSPGGSQGATPMAPPHDGPRLPLPELGPPGAGAAHACRSRCATSSTRRPTGSGASPPRSSSSTTACRFRAFPLVRLSHPQLNLRYYVLDAEGHPAVYFRRVLVPLWVMPRGAPCSATCRHARRGSTSRTRRSTRRRRSGPGGWADGGDLVVRARRGAPPAGAGPELGGWEDTVRFFRERRRGYTATAGGLHRFDTQQPRDPVWPMKVELDGGGLVKAGLGLAQDVPLELHSAWLSPEMALMLRDRAGPRGGGAGAPQSARCRLAAPLPPRPHVDGLGEFRC